MTSPPITPDNYEECVDKREKEIEYIIERMSLPLKYMETFEVFIESIKTHFPVDYPEIVNIESFLNSLISLRENVDTLESAKKYFNYLYTTMSIIDSFP